MWVVSLKRLREFWSIHARAEVSLRGWFTQVSAAQWRNFSDLRATFSSADLVGNCTVFNVGGNNYRLIARIFYASHKVYVLRVMTHDAYSREDWQTQCRCFEPPPPRSRPAQGPKTRQRPKRRKKP
jgi:mRNA interferase HigB